MQENYMYTEALNKLLETTSKRALAKAIGINVGILIQYLKSDYNGNIEGVNSKIKAYLERAAKREKNSKDVIVETQTLKKIFKIIDLIHVMRKMGIVYGPAGLGKTTSAKTYIERTPGSYLITALPDSKTVAGAITLIYHTLFKEEPRVSPRAARRMVVDRLKGSDAMIIVDDAHKLTNDAIEELRAIHDATECAFTLIGTEELLNRLIDPRAGRILAQTSSRLPIRRLFPLQPSKADLRAVCEVYGVNDKDIIARLADKGRRGGLRLTVNQIKIANRLAKGAPINMNHMLAAEAISGDYVDNGNHAEDTE